MSMPADALRGVHAGQTTEPEVSVKLLAETGGKHLELKILFKNQTKRASCAIYACCSFPPSHALQPLSADVAYHLLALHTAGIHRK